MTTPIEPRIQAQIDAWHRAHPEVNGTVSYHHDSVEYALGYLDGLVDARDIIDGLGPSHFEPDSDS